MLQWSALAVFPNMFAMPAQIVESKHNMRDAEERQVSSFFFFFFFSVKLTDITAKPLLTESLSVAVYHKVNETM